MPRSFEVAFATCALALTLCASTDAQARHRRRPPQDRGPQIIRVGEDSQLRVQLLQSTMKRYKFTPMGPQRAPDFYAPDMAGGTASLANVRGDWVALVFFATWCLPCQEEMPALNKFADDAAGKMRVLAVATNSRQHDVNNFMGRFAVRFPVAYDVEQKVAHAYSVGAFPTTFILEPGGKIVGVKHGVVEWDKTRAMLQEIKSIDTTR